MNDEPEHDPSSDTNRYEFSGIEERHGSVPLWLAAVYAVMFIFMVYYLIKYWTDGG
jgi:hypothetical protein